MPATDPIPASLRHEFVIVSAGSYVSDVDNNRWVDDFTFAEKWFTRERADSALVDLRKRLPCTEARVVCRVRMDHIAAQALIDKAEKSLLALLGSVYDDEVYDALKFACSGLANARGKLKRIA